MALDAFGREIRPGDLIAVNSSGNAFIGVQVVSENPMSAKTVDGIRSMKVIIITEEIARGHQAGYYKDRREYDVENNRWIVEDRPLTEVRDEAIENIIQMSREIKERCGIVD